MAVAGVSHVTFSCTDVRRSEAFYRDVLGFEPLASWPEGAYLVAGDLWLALVEGPSETRAEGDYSHLALQVGPRQFERVSTRLDDAGAPSWQENRSEGESRYFCDPDGRQLEIHATTLADRIESCVANPWPGLELVPDAQRRARPAPSVADPRKPRRLACAPVGVFVVVFDADDRVLFLRDPDDRTLQVPNGSMEPGEDPSLTASRELREEAGPIDVGPVHNCAAFNVEYHPHLPPLLSVGFVCRYEGGEPVPGDDMAACTVDWLGIDDIDPTELFIPADVDDLRRALLVLDALA